MLCGYDRMWGKPAGECGKLLFPRFPQRLLSIRSLCVEDLRDSWRESEQWQITGNINSITGTISGQISNVSCNPTPSFCILDCSEFYLHGPLQESCVLVWPCGGPRWVLEKSSSERYLEEDLQQTYPLTTKIIQTPVIIHVIQLIPAIYFVVSTVKHLLTGAVIIFFNRPFLWRHTSRSHHLNWQSTVDWVQKQQQLVGKRLFSGLRRYSTGNVMILLSRVNHQPLRWVLHLFSHGKLKVEEQKAHLWIKQIAINLTSHLLWSHLWGRGEAGQRPDPIPQLSWWLPVQQSVRVENHSSRRFWRWPLISVVWGKLPFVAINYIRNISTER